jgi:uncharacterized spore protein YtfJ
MSIDQMLQTITTLQETPAVKHVFGEPTVVGERTIITIAEVSYGFGFGYGGGPEHTDASGTPVKKGGGGGGGSRTRARPVAVLEVTPDGMRVEPIVDVPRISLAGMALGAWTVFWVAATLRKFAKARERGAI